MLTSLVSETFRLCHFIRVFQHGQSKDYAQEFVYSNLSFWKKYDFHSFYKLEMQSYLKRWEKTTD